MAHFLEKIFGNLNEKEVKKLMKEVEKIEALEPEIEKLGDNELKAKTQEFKDRVLEGESLDDLLYEAFAVVREASKRVLKMRHFPVQLLGGIALHQGRIAEMKTGEGKTLVATLPAYLNALSGEGVHIVTVNDYLAKRDSEWMGEVYEFLGLKVGLIVHGLDFDQRKEAYGADITYGTNNEFGFDYLRDNMVAHKEKMVQRNLNYAIIDEVDSILIDEARTPLIISGSGDKSTKLYDLVDAFVKKLKKEEHFNIDEKARTVVLTEEGDAKAEEYFGLENLADPENMELTHHINQALKAYHLMKKDSDYVVKDGEVIIVDEFTGRLMLGRRYSDGLHQAIEAKERVQIERESKTLATITFQNYFRLFKKLSGMTGTAKTEEDEFKAIYGMDVLEVPTNKPMIREDMPDIIYKNENGKLNAIVQEIKERNRVGQPVLVGTITIEKSEDLSRALKKQGIPHQVLNAKYHEKEAEIITHAGQKGMVTIATNMAGRGTDIVLGEGVKEIGGLHIIGTERHESRRIDNQLRGRSGRQGDAGSSRFYISLEDDLMRLFGSDRVLGLVESVGLEEDQPIEHGMLTKGIENAQKKVEARNFSIRKHVLQYDDVMNKQREIIYKQRRQVLEGEDIQDQISLMLESFVEDYVQLYTSTGTYFEEWDLKGLWDFMEKIILPKNYLALPEQELSREELSQLILNAAKEVYNKKEEKFGADQMRELERVMLLQIVDKKWMDHIDAMDQLKQGIGLRAYGQVDPVQAYQKEGFNMFEEMNNNIQEDALKYLFHVEIKKVPQPKQQVDIENVVTNKGEGAKAAPVVKNDKIGRNDPCPCGSGKKYKKCCGQ